MKIIPSIALAAAALSTASLALAADVPGRRAAPAPAPVYTPPPPIFTWTGFYVGLNAGYGFSSKNKASYSGDPGYLALGANVPRSYSLKRNGFVGGAQVGYNYQSGAFVGGVEADINFETGKKTSTVVAPQATGSARSQLGAFGTLRARGGFLVTDRWLAYATGGVIVGQTKLSNTITGTAPPLAGAVWSGSTDKTKAGYVVGVGTEYAFTNNITARLEYLYYDLGKTSVRAAPANAAATALGVAATLRESNAGSIVRTGLNFKF